MGTITSIHDPSQPSSTPLPFTPPSSYTALALITSNDPYLTGGAEPLHQMIMPLPQKYLPNPTPGTSVMFDLKLYPDR